MSHTLARIKKMSRLNHFERAFRPAGGRFNRPGGFAMMA
jgi:hypothetical protein